MSELLQGSDRTVVHLRSVAAFAVAVLVVVLTLVALLLFARGVTGYFVEPLEFMAALAMGFGLSIASWLMRTAAKRVVLEEVQRRSLMVLAVVATWLLVAALTFSPLTSLAVLALWLPVIAMESAWWALPPEAPLVVLNQAPEVRAATPVAVARETELDASVVQQLTRVQHDGVEIITGIAQLEFAAEEQTTVLHLAFCPPLAHDPVVFAKVVAADGVTVKAAECRSYGLRLEAKRGRETSQPLTVRVEIEARAVG